jgi:hypothetical protein
MHAFTRLTYSIAVLLSNNRKSEYKDLWLKMMDVCCRDVCKITEGIMPDFAVKEIMLAYKAMSKQIPGEMRRQWLSYLKKVEPYVNYERVYTKSDELNNINIYNLSGEYLRETEGLTDTTDYYDKHWPLQYKNFDINGMYIDPNAPMLYDITTRVHMQLILGSGYNGIYKTKLDEYLKNAGYMTLFMQSSANQLPFGGRSNQFHFNEALVAANCEYEAVRYKKLGDLKTAGVFKRTARLAAKSIERWIIDNPPMQIKNFYPNENMFGTEDYAYYDKYIVTLGSFISTAYMYADDTIQEVPCPSELGGYVFQTSNIFHKVFANCLGNSIEIDTRADAHYDSTGIGRFHKNGVPTELALSVPFTSHPNYNLPEELLKGDISISPGWDNGCGKKQFLSQLSVGIESKVTIIIQYRVGLLNQITAKVN